MADFVEYFSIQANGDLSHITGAYLDKATRPDIAFKKMIITGFGDVKVVYVDNSNNNRVVRQYILTKPFRDDIRYKNISQTPAVDFYVDKFIPQTELRVAFLSRNNPDMWASSQIDADSVLPKISIWDDGETETDEVATETVYYPFQEEPIWLFQDLMFRRLYPITRNFLEGLNAERVALLTKVDQLAGGVGDDEDHRRYDHAANLGRGLIGYTWEQINILSDDTLPASEKKTRAEINQTHPTPVSYTHLTLPTKA